MNITIRKNGLTLDYKAFNFPGGEVGVKLNAGNYKYREEKADHQTIVARIQNSDDLIGLAMVKDAINRFDSTPIHLVVPYVPYGRQDRMCDKGESFSLKVLADYLNHLDFPKVTIFDSHSEVTPALIDNVKVVSQFDIINKHLEFINVCNANKTVFVSPDAGANKKTAELAGFFNKETFVRADKLRDLTNGNIKETIVYTDDFKKMDVIVADDLCDGGRTYLELAKVCKAKNCGKVILYVTHGIFSKGIETLFAGGIDEIWTTDAFKTEFVLKSGLVVKETTTIEGKVFNILKLEERFKDLW